MFLANKKGETPLHKACERGHLETVKLLLQHGAEMERETKKFCRTPLHLSILHDRLGVAGFLMSSGANIYALDNDESSILHMSLWTKQMTIFILDYLAKEDSSNLDRLLHLAKRNGNTCLHSAFLLGKLDLAWLLLDRGSDLRAVNSKGETALHMACQTFLSKKQTTERQTVVEHLINKGAEIDAQDHDGLTPLHVAASNDDDDSLLLVKCLLNNKAGVNVQNQKGETPLHLAHKADVAAFLMRNGAIIDVQDHDGLTPLHVAASNDDDGSLLLVKCLVNNKADVNVQNQKGETPLHLAHKTDVIDFLLKNGATINAQDYSGST